MARKDDNLLRKFNAYASSSAENDPILLGALRSIQQEEEERLRQEQAGIRPPEAPPSFEGVSSSVDSTAEEPQPAPSLWDRAGSAASGSLDSLVGGFGREVGSAVFTDADLDGQGVRIADLLSPVTGPMQSVWQALPESARLAVGQAIYEQGSEQAQGGREELVDNVPVIGGALSDVLANPSSAASLLGGPVGVAIGGSTAFNQSYTESRMGGLSEDDAMIRAGGNAALEGALSAIPAGQYLDRFLPNSMSDPLKDYLRGRVGNVVARTGAASVGEAGQEAVTELAQIGWDKTLSELAPSEDLRKFSSQQLPKDITELWDRTKQAGAAGALGGTIYTAPTVVMQDMQQTGQLVSELLNSYPETPATTTTTQGTPAPTSAVEDLFGPVPTAPSPVQETVAVEQDTGPAPEQTSFLPPVGPEISGTAVERIQSVRSEVQKSRERAEQRRQKAAENARNKARRSFIDEQIQATSNLDSQEADSLVTRRTLDWDQQNPVENFLDQTTTQPRTRQAPPRPAQVTPVQDVDDIEEQATTPSTVSGRTSGEQIDTLLQEAGFSSTVPTSGADLAQAQQETVRAEREFLSVMSPIGGEARRLSDTIISSKDSSGLSGVELANEITQAYRQAAQDARNPNTLLGTLRSRALEAQQAERSADFDRNLEGLLDSAVEAIEDSGNQFLQRRTAREVRSSETSLDAAAAIIRATDVLNQSGLSSVTSSNNGTETTYSGREAIQSIIDNIGQGDARTAARILTNGNTRLVDDTSQIPADNVPTNSGAYYIPSTGQTFIVASSLRKDQPVVGQILDRAAHEHKHAGDLSANEDLRRGALSTLIGVERNEEINNRIRAAAQNNDPVAQAALSRLQNSGETGARAELELPAYFIEESRKARRNSSAVNRIGRDILSAVRTGAKQVLPGDYTVSLDDVAYLSDRLLQQAATTQQSTAATRQNAEASGLSGEGLAMVQGPTSARFVEARDNGWVYRSMDGTEKFVTSDANSRLNRTAVRTLNEYSKLDGERLQGLTAESVLSHDELFNDYPQLRNLSIVVDPELAEGAAYYSADGTDPSHVRINGNDARAAMRSPRAMDELRGLILHELQHAVQDIEGSALGGNPNMFKTPADRQVQVRAESGMVNFNTTRQEAYNMVTDESSDVPAANRQMLTDILVDYGDKSLSMKEVTDNLKEELALLPEGSNSRELFQRLVDAAEAVAPDRAAARAAQTRAERDYMDLLGEREAYFTQFQRDLDQDQLPRNPEDPNEATGFTDAQPENARQYDGRAILRRNNEDLVADRFEPGQFEAPVEGLASVAEGEAAALPQVPRRQGRVQQAADVAGTVFRRAVMSDGGVSNEIAEAVRAARNSQSAEALNSNILTNNFNLAIGNARIGLREKMGENVTAQEVRERLLDDIEQIDQLATREEREAAIDALDQKYPMPDSAADAGMNSISKVLRDIRRTKQDYTRAIIAARRANPKPLTKKEENVFRKMLENDERYTTRAYLATYDQEVGKEYGKRLLDAAYNDTNSPEYQVVNDAMNFIVENDLLIPPMNQLMRMPIEKLRHMYEYWGMGSAANFKSREGKRELAERLSEKVDASRSEMEARAMLIIRDMLGQGTDETGARRRAVRTARADTTITQGRTGIPKELRRLLGEITDPVMRETLTLHRMGNFVTKMNLMNELHERGQGKFWSDTPSEKFKNHLAENEGYGPLAGKYLDDDTFYALSSVVKSEQELDVTLGEAMRNPAAATELFSDVTMRSMRGLIGAQKFAQVVVSPANMALNLIGSPLMLMANGIVNPFTAARGAKAAATALTADVNLNLVSGDRAHGIATEMAKAGALDTASVGMFQSDFFREVQAELRAQVRRGEDPSIIRAGWEKARAGGRFTKDVLRNAYALMDVWVKVATYLDRKDFWTNVNSLEGMGLSDTEIQRRAGWDASTTNISYDRAIPIARAIEQNSPFGMFLTYFSEAMVRVPMMNMVQAGRDAKLARTLTNPEARQMATGQAARRAVGTLTATVGVIAATLTALGAEDEEQRLKRNVDPEWYRNSVMIPFGKDENGMPRYYPVNRIDPLGPLNEAVVAIASADEDERLDAVWDVVTDQFVFSKSIGAVWQMLTDVAADASGNPDWDQRAVRNSTGEYLKTAFPEFYNTITRLDNDGDIPENLINLVDTFIPTGLKGTYDPDRNIVGFRPYVRDAEKSMRFRIYDHNKVTRNTRRELLDYAEQRPSTAQLMYKMNSLLDREERSFQDLHGTLQGYLVSEKDAEGKRFSRSDASKLFRDEQVGGLYRDTLKGRFKSSAINEKTLKRWYDDKYKEAKTQEERKQLREDFRMLRQAYRDVMQERNSNG